MATPRTEQQNRALHLYFTQVASALNDAGYDIQKTLTNYRMELDWTPESIKECMWRPAQKALLGKHSTTELSKQEEIDRVYEAVNRFLAKLEIEHIPFPSYEHGFMEHAPLKDEAPRYQH